MRMEKDRITALPDEILIKILSFSHTRDVVQTSILSKRWRHVWTSVPCIDIDDPKISPDWDNRRCDKVKASFLNFVFLLLHLHVVHCLRKFRLHCRNHDKNYYEASYVRFWIDKAVSKRGLEELDLNFSNWIRIELPPSFFTFKKLVVLKLGHGIVFEVPTLVDLPSLKTLYVHGLRCDNENSMENLLGGCPVLEELDIDKISPQYFGGGETIFIRSSSLKRLILDTGCRHYLKFVIDAINLERLHIMDHSSIIDYDITSLSSSVKVNLRLCKSCSYNSRLVQLLRKLTHIKYMFLSCSITESIGCAQLDELPMFHNLTHLVLESINSSRSFPININCRTVLPYLLECAPNLVKFVVSLKEQFITEQQLLPFKVPKCSMLYLEEVELTGFKNSEYEIEMVKYFLNNATILKKLSIRSGKPGGSNKQSKFSKKLLKYPRTSLDCQIIFD